MFFGYNHGLTLSNTGAPSVRPTDASVDNFIDMLATPYARPQQAASEKPLPNTGVKIHFTAIPPIHDNILVSQGYLQRLESENHMFRRHLRDLEIAVADRLERTIMKGLGEIVEQKETPLVETETTGSKAEDVTAETG